MASVLEIKQELLTDQEAAQQAFQLAVSSISTVSSIASWTLTALGVLVAVIAIFGFAIIVKAARYQARAVANEVVTHYLSSDAFSRMLEQKVAESLAERDRSMVAKDDNVDDADPFPAPQEDNR